MSANGTTNGTTTKEKSDDSVALQATCNRVSGLIRIATDAAAAPEEARTAAITAVGLMKETTLL